MLIGRLAATYLLSQGTAIKNGSETLSYCAALFIYNLYVHIYLVLTFMPNIVHALGLL